MTDPAGKLKITLAPDGATISSTRPVRAAGIFVGRGVAETMRLLPALFSVCATAQSAAGGGAIEQALGLTADPETAALRRRLVEAETLREHLWRILLDWPGSLGETADAAAMAQVIHQTAGLRTALSGGADPFAPGATGIVPDRQAADFAQDALIALAAEQVFGLAPAKWLGRIERLDHLTHWAQDTDTVAGRLVRQIIAAG
jgi:uptake hydrogenase large subunit